VENALKGEKTITINEPDQLASSIHNYSPKQKFSDQYRYNAVNIPQAIAFSKEILNPRTLSNPSLNQKNISLPSFESISKQNDRIIGQLKNSYILVETAEGLLLLDQHAVHERIRYEKLITNFKQQKKDAQKLLIPIEIDLSLGEINLLRQHLHLFKELGFDLELSNQQTCQITAIPNALIAQDPAEMIRSLIDEFDSFKPEKGQTIDNLAEIIIIFLACRKSIMFGDPLHFTEMEQLYHDWQRCSQKETCPHGRQLSWVITWEEMRHKVNRN
jgi:DNA mismatch repair ATPase MutL